MSNLFMLPFLTVLHAAFLASYDGIGVDVTFITNQICFVESKTLIIKNLLSVLLPLSSGCGHPALLQDKKTDTPYCLWNLHFTVSLIYS